MQSNARRGRGQNEVNVKNSVCDPMNLYLDHRPGYDRNIVIFVEEMESKN